MVRGIDTFKEFFKDFDDNYVIIGGTACEIHEELYAQTPRATKDMNFPEDARITPIPTDEDLSSLSAILMDNDYYHFTIRHSALEDDVHIANIESLICLKCKAFLDLSNRKQLGESVDSKHIAKHKKDVFRLAAMLAPTSKYELPDTLMKDVNDFCDKVMEELPNTDFLKSAGLGNVSSEQIVKQLKKSML